MVRKKKDEDTEVKVMQGKGNQQTPQEMEMSSHGSMEKTDYTDMFNAMMPMVMMIMMMAIMMPMMKGLARETNDK